MSVPYGGLLVRAFLMFILCKCVYFRALHVIDEYLMITTVACTNQLDDTRLSHVHTSVDCTKRGNLSSSSTIILELYSPTMTSIKSLTSFKLDLPPSCIEFFPLRPDFAIIGTYNLEKPTDEGSSESAPSKDASKPQQRNGSLILIRVDGDNVYV
jgi:hypothetical protein